jgi:hypothetical protein
MLVNTITELYRKKLMFSSMSDSLLIILFNSFNLMFKPVSKANQHILLNTNFVFIDHVESSPLVSGLFFNLSFITEEGNDVFKFTLFKDKQQYYSDSITVDIINDNGSNIDVFIKKCSEEVLGKFFELCNKEKVITEITNKHIGEVAMNAPPSSFLKKIKTISESGFLYKYTMEFTDGTNHSIFTPSELNKEIKPGDFGHHDGGEGFMFLHHNQIQ